MDRRERNRKICEAWLEGRSASEIGFEYGLGPDMVRKVVYQSGIRKSDRQRRSRKRAPEEKRPLSDTHRKIGVRISHQRELELKMSASEFADKANISAKKLVQIEQGIYDPTIYELEKIANVSGLPMGELVN